MLRAGRHDAPRRHGGEGYGHQETTGSRRERADRVPRGPPDGGGETWRGSNRLRARPGASGARGGPGGWADPVGGRGRTVAGDGDPRGRPAGRWPRRVGPRPARARVVLGGGRVAVPARGPSAVVGDHRRLGPPPRHLLPPGLG